MTKNNKILVLSLGKSGGLPRYAYKVVEQLELMVPCVLFVSKYSDFSFSVHSKILKIHTYKGVLSFILSTTFILPFYLIGLSWYLFSCNYIYIPYTNPWHTIFGVFGKILGKKIIFTVHDCNIHPGEINKSEIIFSDFILKFSDHLVFLSAFVKNLTFNKFTIKKPFSIIPQGIIDLPSNEFSPQFSTKPTLLFLGRIIDYKGLDLLLEAAKNNPNVGKLVIAGKSPKPLKIIDEKVTLVNRYLSDEEITTFLKEAHILVLPYKEASQSGIITLGVNYHLPMIITNVGGLTEQLSENEAVICNPDSMELRLAIRRLSEDRDLYESLVNTMKNKQKALQTNWAKTAQAVASIL